MLELATRDAVEHRAVWAGAFLITAVTSMFTTVCCRSICLGLFGADSAFLAPQGREILLKTASNLLLLSGAPAILVLSMVLNTIVAQTRRVHSQWRLAGASPQQVVRIFGIQVVLVAACGALAGALAAIPFGPVVSVLLGRGQVAESQRLPELAGVLSVLVSILIVTLWGTLSGVFPAVHASRTSALASQESDGSFQGTPRWLSGFLAFVFFVQIPLLVPLFVVPASQPVAVGIITLLPASQALVITLALLAPYYLTALIRVWTNVPLLIRWVPWRIAQHLAAARVNQSAGTVVPVAIGIGLFASFNIVTAAAMNAQKASINIFDGILMLTPIGVIGALGGATVMLMASGRRTEDLTSLRVAGASPLTSVAVFVSEATIYIVTALLMAMLSSLGTLLLLSMAARRWQTSIDLTGVDLTGSLAVTVLGGMATISIVVLGGVSAWRHPLATYLVKE